MRNVTYLEFPIKIRSLMKKPVPRRNSRISVAVAERTVMVRETLAEEHR
jgi:hypothetical protein